MSSIGFAPRSALTTILLNRPYPSTWPSWVGHIAMPTIHKTPLLPTMLGLPLRISAAAHLQDIEANSVIRHVTGVVPLLAC